MKKFFTLLLMMVLGSNAFANNMLVQNVTTTGNNATNKTIQVQFDLSWDNSWRDGINWDAAWIFMKFKNASGVWQHVQINTTGFNNGTGTANTVQVTSDKVGAWVYRSAQGSGTFNSTNMQLQWNYGLSGLTSVAGLEVRVYAIEMVYVPQGDFNCAKFFWNNPTQPWDAAPRSFVANGNNFAVINNKLSPILTYNNGTSISLRVKGDAGLDVNNDGIVDNTYPTGYNAFYCYKYELTEQQYADFLNTLTSTQLTTLGVAGSGIVLSNGKYFSSTPNKACGNSNEVRTLAYADWSGVRPMSFLEFNKASYGPNQPIASSQTCSGCWVMFLYPASNSINWGNSLIDVGYFAGFYPNPTRGTSGASYYGILELTGNAHEPTVKLSSFNFNSNGNGTLSTNGTSDVNNWPSGCIDFIDEIRNVPCSGCTTLFTTSKYGFRYVRSTE
jgi:hypothetical protein